MAETPVKVIGQGMITLMVMVFLFFSLLSLSIFIFSTYKRVRSKAKVVEEATTQASTPTFGVLDKINVSIQLCNLFILSIFAAVLDPYNGYYFFDQILVRIFAGFFAFLSALWIVGIVLFVVPVEIKMGHFKAFLKFGGMAWSLVRLVWLLVYIILAHDHINANTDLMLSLENGLVEETFGTAATLTDPKVKPFDHSAWFFNLALDGGYAVKPAPAYEDIVFHTMSETSPPIEWADHPYPGCQNDPTMPWSRDWKMNVYVREDLKGLANPTILYISGGNYYSADRDSFSWDYNHFIDRGYAIVRAHHPQVCNRYSFDDSASFYVDFVHWLRDNGASYGIDKENIALMGTSSGGHLAQLVGWRMGSELIKGVTMFTAPTNFYSDPPPKGMTPLQFIITNYSTHIAGRPSCPSWSNSMNYDGVDEPYPSLGYGAPNCHLNGPFKRFDNLLCANSCEDLCTASGTVTLEEEDNGSACSKVSPLHTTHSEVPPLLFFSSKTDIYCIPSVHGDAQCARMEELGVPCLNVVYDKLGHVLEGGPKTLGGSSATFALERFLAAIFSAE
ncbi:hypothetical protein TrVE_jg14447 [Triparma verrucosa]|uniref:BD-FAE-like domain-containing protein n=1 Tax=Triparma verrucosa TaxID=1606542 RepID=A0A9W7EZQ3_9STRA|nr:hypothetical protein TrVE_jg14447 [Triparma verrucosa]